MFLVDVIVPLLVAVCGACANWTAPSPRCTLNIVVRGVQAAHCSMGICMGMVWLQSDECRGYGRGGCEEA